jgi:hypothetical protein
MPLPLAAAGIEAGVGLLQTGIGIAQKIKAAKLARSNIRPVLKDNPYIDQGYALAGSMASQGLSDATRQAYQTGIDRNLSAGIDAITRAGGSVNNIGDLIDSGSSALREMAYADQQIKARNTSQFLDAIQKKADEDRDQWFLNEYAPYQDRAAMISQLSGQGMTNIFKGINTAGSAAMGALQSDIYNEQSPQGSPQAYMPSMRRADLSVTTAPIPIGSAAISPTLMDLSTESLLSRFR